MLAKPFSYTVSLIFCYVQYVFMFQWPKLPELALSIGDYKTIQDSFTAPPMVRLPLQIILPHTPSRSK